MGCGRILQPRTAIKHWKTKAFLGKDSRIEHAATDFKHAETQLYPGFHPEQLNELSVSQLTHCTQRRSAVQGWHTFFCAVDVIQDN